MLEPAGIKQLPFADVDKVIRMQKIKNVWYVRTGWQGAALKKQQEEQAQMVQAAEQDAKSTVDQALRSGAGLKDAITSRRPGPVS